jgi:molecular chaperone GrpE
MTTGRSDRPAGAPADWQDRDPAGAPAAAERAAREGEASAAEAKSEPDVAFFPDSGKKATNPADDASAEAVDADLASLVEDVKRERDEYLDLAKRAKADFENYRKRAAQQTSDAERRAKVSLASSILPAVDNLERALEAAPEDDPLADGVRMVLNDLNGALTRAGVESFDPSGEKFDPNTSEALSSQPGNGAEPGTVLETLTRGYRLGDHVVRPARVVVAE